MDTFFYFLFSIVLLVHVLNVKVSFFTDSLSSPDLESSCVVETEELRFHHVHGQNAVIVNNGRTATRPNASGEFNDAIIMSNRPLKDNELFEIIIEKMVDRWSGSIEAGKIIIL